MQDKISILETKVSQLTFEIKALVQTQKDINATLKEFKDLHTKIILVNKDIENLKTDNDKQNKRLQSHSERLRDLEKSDINQGIKLSSAERLFWITITGGIGFIVAYLKGKI